MYFEMRGAPKVVRLKPDQPDWRLALKLHDKILLAGKPLIHHFKHYRGVAVT